MRAVVVDRRLESIAGPPLAWRDTPGTTAAWLPPLRGRTLYSTVEIISTDSEYVSIARLGRGGAGMNLRVESAGSTALGSRIDTIDGSTNATLYRNGPRAPGRHVLCVRVNDGMTRATFQADDYPAQTRALLADSGGMDSADLVLAAPIAAQIPLQGVAYAGEHSDRIMGRIMGWLARHDGAPIPGGY